MSPDLIAYFDHAVTADFAASLGPLGRPTAVSGSGASTRGGMTYRRYTVNFAGRKTVTISVYAWPDGKLEQFLVSE